jgi:hypothetical protein
MLRISREARWIIEVQLWLMLADYKESALVNKLIITGF